MCELNTLTILIVHNFAVAPRAVVGVDALVNAGLSLLRRFSNELKPEIPSFPRVSSKRAGTEMSRLNAEVGTTQKADMPVITSATRPGAEKALNGR